MAVLVALAAISHRNGEEIALGATGADGRDNRRVSLVIDYAGTGVAAPM